ncbi:hypothetical protein ASG54_09205 [Aureimonas sp. Leaf460]|nr:hypothetical protein ASG62_06610 [Aureimonas sp. Leaf427]KQT79471.1 hypothetical protein ASG54_09205 [Aureimonas sp. Leaf460]
MPVPHLETARASLASLGFTVAPDAVHPFGTENACIFFSDGTYIEPLGIAEREVCEVQAIAGNVFVAHDQAYRFRRGVPGFEGLAFASDDALADRGRFERAGIADGEILEFRRLARSPDGSEAELGFRLAFARDRRAPDLSLFACEPIHRFKPDRSALTGHPNGTTGIRRVVMSEPNPTDFQYLLQEVVGERSILADGFGFSIETGNVTIEVASPDALGLRYGAARDGERGLRIEGLVLGTRDLSAVEDHCRRAGAPATRLGERLVVRLGSASGAFLAFERV